MTNMQILAALLSMDGAFIIAFVFLANALLRSAVNPKARFHEGQIVIYVSDQGPLTRYIMHIHAVKPHAKDKFRYDGYLYIKPQNSNNPYEESLDGLEYRTTIINVPEGNLRVADTGTAGHLSMKQEV